MTTGANPSNEERFQRLIKSVGKAFYTRFIDRVRQAVTSGKEISLLKKTARKEWPGPIRTADFRIGYMARAVRAGFALDASEEPPHEGEPTPESTGYWFQSHWPQPDGHPGEEFYIWLKEDNLGAKAKIRTGDHVLFFLSRNNPRGKPGSSTIFCSGTVQPEEESIHEIHGGKVWSYRRSVKPDIQLDPQSGISPNEARNLVGWHPQDPFYQRSGQIEADEFDTLAAELRRRKSGPPTKPRSELRYSRICWNTNGWRHPSGPDSKTEKGSYVAEHGFGHEEWLFNFGYIVDGLHYGFLQPINKNYRSARERIFDIKLYTHSPEGPLWIGEIRNCRVINEADAHSALQIYRDRGWLAEMGLQLKTVGVDAASIEASKPLNIFNIKFDPRDVEIYDPYQEPLPDHKIRVSHRYQLFKGEVQDFDPSKPSKPPGLPKSGRRKSEEMRRRIVIRETLYDPIHDRIQGRLTDLLEAKYGKDAVRYEAEFVDISVHETRNGQPWATFFEVKTEHTAKRCIRLALGQLLEYSCYPNKCAAQSLIVVGVAPASTADLDYLNNLSIRHALPLGYWQFDAEKNTVCERIGFSGPSL